MTSCSGVAKSASNLTSAPVAKQAGVLYGATMADMALREWASARQHMARLQALPNLDAPAAYAVRLLSTELALAMGDATQALDVIEPKARVLASDDRAGHLLLAQSRLASKQVAQAKLDLAVATWQRLKIVAPFDGVTGLRQVNVGDYLKDGTDVVNIEDIDAVLVDFRLPERFQAKVRPGQKAQLTVDALPGRPFAAIVQVIFGYLVGDYIQQKGKNFEILKKSGL